MSQSDDPFEGKGGLKPWRPAERERLIAARPGLSADLRSAHAAIIAGKLDAIVDDVRGKVIAIYWPFRGEPDLRGWAGKMSDQGATIALPVVVEKAAPLVFRSWKAGEKLEKGVWNIPFPAEGAEVTPDVVISPVVGFDGGNYRLGYGGGFYDRTLAALTRRPVVIGVGYALQRIATIHPQPHDIAMDIVLTEAR